MPELLILNSLTFPVIVSLTVPEETEEEDGVLEELAGSLEEIGAWEDETAGVLATVSSEKSVRNASAAPPGRDESRRCGRHPLACSSGRRARTEYCHSGKRCRTKHPSILSPIFFMFCIPRHSTDSALLLTYKNRSRALMCMQVHRNTDLWKNGTS